MMTIPIINVESFIKTKNCLSPVPYNTYPKKHIFLFMTQFMIKYANLIAITYEAEQIYASKLMRPSCTYNFLIWISVHIF